MSKERLESLKRNREWTEATGGKFYTVDSDDYKWLIKQAERVQELEQQNERYREALESIKELGKWGMFTDKYARIAQKALEGEK